MTEEQSMTQPTPKQIKAARNAAGLTQTQAGALVGVLKRTWVAWESDEDFMLSLGYSAAINR